MSVHLFVAAAYLEGLDPSVKWVLAAIADSADEHTLESAPGLPKLRAWSGRSKSQVTRIVGDLETSGHIARISPGRLGRRAVYRVFPNGVPAIPHPDEVAARFVIPQVVDNSENYPQDASGEGRTHAPHRGAWTPELGRTGAPPSCTTSVPLHESATQRIPQVGDKPASRPSPSGFPGARTRTEDRPDPRTQRGHHDQPCPLHPEHVVPCGRCAHAAATSDPAKVAQARQQARAATRAAKAPATKETRRP